MSDAEDFARWVLSIPDGLYEVRRGSSFVRVVDLTSRQAKIDALTDLRDFLKRSRADNSLSGSITRTEG